MPRRSQWDDNDAMWEHVARLRAGGLKYEDIIGRLNGIDRAKFGLEATPTESIIRYNLNKRRLLGRNPSPLPPDELEEHYRALTYIGNVIRYTIAPPPSFFRETGRLQRATSKSFSGFDDGLEHFPEANTPAEEEVLDEWYDDTSRSFGPEVFSQFDYYREHMNCTFLGRKVLNALDAVGRTVAEYNAEHVGLMDGIRVAVDQALSGEKEAGKKDLVAMLFGTIQPTNKYPNGRSKLISGFRRDEPDLETKVREVLEDFKSSSANADLIKKFKKLTTAQNNLKSAVVPTTKVRRTVQDAECELCSSKPLERAE